MDLHTLNKFLTIKDKHILLYEHNAFTSHLMLDSDERSAGWMLLRLPLLRESTSI